MVAIDVEPAVIIDIGGKMTVEAGRPQPPPRSRAVCVSCNPRGIELVVYRPSVLRAVPQLPAVAEIPYGFLYAQQEYLVDCISAADWCLYPGLKQ